MEEPAEETGICVLSAGSYLTMPEYVLLNALLWKTKLSAAAAESIAINRKCAGKSVM